MAGAAPCRPWPPALAPAPFDPVATAPPVPAAPVTRRAPSLQTDMSIRVVWDHWLLDSICHLKRQAEANFAVRMDEEEHDASYVPGRLEAMAPASAPPAPAAEPQPTYRGLSADEGLRGMSRARASPRPFVLLPARS